MKAHSKRELQYYKSKGMEAKLVKRQRNKFRIDNRTPKQYTGTELQGINESLQPLSI